MGNLHGEFRLGEKAFSSILRRELTLHGTWNSKVVPRGTDDWSTVLKYMGIPAVSEAAALLAVAPGGRLLLEKFKYQGSDGKNATLSIAERMNT